MFFGVFYFPNKIFVDEGFAEIMKININNIEFFGLIDNFLVKLAVHSPLLAFHIGIRTHKTLSVAKVGVFNS